MTTRIGINGLGRIGRDYLRYVLDADDLDVGSIGRTGLCHRLRLLQGLRAVRQRMPERGQLTA